ncbi:hypothetical protein [Bacillus horti]|uniref:SnoaL-like domain-containing protein n=1 Tax=Caldalkalibacillus horti TaxID=77523 RepID=A0ABT9W3R9_9BACI|nr:hypothetical protein [Bacillus horti]MDQ0167765.1 hypothetical protein [Bacillus horti]
MAEKMNLVEQFKSLHDEFASLWAEAMKSGHTDKVVAMYDKDYSCTVFMKDNSQSLVFQYEEAMEGLMQSVQALIGAQKRFENCIIHTKHDSYSYVFYEQVIVQDNKELSRIFTTEEWALKDDQWLIVREVNTIIS